MEDFPVGIPSWTLDLLRFSLNLKWFMILLWKKTWKDYSSCRRYNTNLRRKLLTHMWQYFKKILKRACFLEISRGAAIRNIGEISIKFIWRTPRRICEEFFKKSFEILEKLLKKILEKYSGRFFGEILVWFSAGAI